MKSLSSSASRLAVCLAVLWFPARSSATSLQLPNLQKVNDQVYRGGQPTDAGFAELAKMGIKTVIDLRSIGEHSQAGEQKIVERGGMRYISIPMQGMSTPSSETISTVLALLQDKAAAPVFVHCKRGADRTGTVIAVYRIGHDHWDNKKALDEAKAYGMSLFQRAMRSFVLHYLPPAEVASDAPALIPIPGAAAAGISLVK